MICEQCTYLLVAGVDSWLTLSSGIRPSWLSSGNPTPAKSCGNEPPKDGSPVCGCGKGMSGCSIHPNTPEAWTASMRASLARILALPENRRGLDLRQEAVYTAKSSESLGSFNHDTCSWKMFPRLSKKGLKQSLPTLPRSGMTRNGYVYELPTVGRTTKGTGGGYSLPTPTSSNGRSEGKINQMRKLVEIGWTTESEAEAMMGGSLRPARMAYWPTPNATPLSNDLNLTCSGDGRTKPNKLGWAVAIWTTPCTDDTSHRKAKYAQGGSALSTQAGGKLNPTWVEWLMAFPLWFTVSRHWVMPKSRSKRQSHGVCSGVNK